MCFRRSPVSKSRVLRVCGWGGRRAAEEFDCGECDAYLIGMGMLRKAVGAKDRPDNEAAAREGLGWGPLTFGRGGVDDCGRDRRGGRRASARRGKTIRM